MTEEQQRQKLYLLKNSMISKKAIKKELDFCIKLREEQGGCDFGK
jgi:hypothetical protein